LNINFQNTFLPKQKNNNMKIAIGIDLGGTNVKGIIVNENGEILMQHYVPTHDDPDGKWRENVLETVNHLRNNWLEPIDLIGLSAPGLANEANTCIAQLPNRLPGLEHFDWAEYFGTKTYVLNDAHSALMAEAKFGALKGIKNGILLTLGTGVGGGILINGELYQGLNQMAGHLGHVSVNAGDDERSILGMPGSIEYAIGNCSIERRSMGKFSSTKALLEAYQAGDSFAIWLWLESLRKLAIFLSSMVTALSPEMIVLSGGITLAKQNLFGPLQTFMDLYEFRPKGQAVPIKQGKFEDLSGALGAAGFALSKIKI
jgi:glucokinase